MYRIFLLSHQYITHSIIKIKATNQSFEFGKTLNIWTNPHLKIVFILNTSLVASGALAHRLQRRQGRE